jgi:hypothetical protein
VKAIVDLIHVPTVRRIINRFDASEDVTPVSYRHGPERLLGCVPVDNFCIVEMLMAQPSIYLNELQQDLHRIIGNLQALAQFRTIWCLGFTRKKV